MLPRIISALSLLGAIASIIICGPDQFSFPYMGLMLGIVLMVASIGSAALLIIIPLTAIAVMIAFVSLTFGALILLAIRSFMAKPPSVFRKTTHWSALLLAVTLICGLTLLQVFPVTQDPPLKVSPEYFGYPFFLALAAITLFLIDKQDEHCDSPNGYSRHASC